MLTNVRKTYVANDSRSTPILEQRFDLLLRSVKFESQNSPLYLCFLGINTVMPIDGRIDAIVPNEGVEVGVEGVIRRKWTYLRLEEEDGVGYIGEFKIYYEPDKEKLIELIKNSC